MQNERTICIKLVHTILACVKYYTDLVIFNKCTSRAYITRLRIFDILNSRNQFITYPCFIELFNTSKYTNLHKYSHSDEFVSSTI